MQQEALPFSLQRSLEVVPEKWNLGELLVLDNILGSCSKQFASVHITGTNGKGSAATKIAKALQWSGKKVGLYTSPHIYSYRERIQVNGQAIPLARCEHLLEKIILHAGRPLAYFELLTLMAFCYFAEERVDCAVIEAGIGGRLDATNIIHHPLLTLITSVDFDHTHILGNSLESIAFEKAGIIKLGVPTLLGPQAKPLHVFESVAREMHSPLVQVTGSFAHYEEENQSIAACALSLLPFPVEKKFLKMGLMSTPPCRFERINSFVVLDAAHNPDGLKRTFERLFFTFPGKKVRVLAAFSKDKALEECLEIMTSHAVCVHLSHSSHYRLREIGEPFEQAFEKAYQLAKKNGEILLVCGSFFILHEARIAARSMWEKEGG